MKPLAAVNGISINNTNNQFPGRATRTVARYQLSAPVIIFWKPDRHSRMRAEGTLFDIGTRGIYVLCATIPPLDVDIHFEILLPPLHEDSSPVRIKGVGRVVREQQGPVRSGFALLSYGLLLRPAARTDQRVGMNKG
jgi:hypothetical protein